MNHHLSPALRITSNLLQLWTLCGKPACRRAQECRRDPAGCVKRYAPLAPEEARCGALALLKGLLDGVDRDEVREFAPDEIEALEQWTARLAATVDVGGETVTNGAAIPRCELKSSLFS